MLSDPVIIHRFDHCERHTFATEVVKCMFDEQATNTLSTYGLIDREIRNTPLTDFIVDTRTNVAEYLPRFVCDENTRRIGLDVLVDMSRFTPSTRAWKLHLVF